MGTKKFWAVSGSILTAVMWGLSFLSIKISVAVIPPMTLALLRFIIASIILIIILKLVEPQTKLNFKDYPLMALAGVVGVTLYFYFENNGVKLTTASTASIVIGTIPIFTLVADAAFLGNRMNVKKIISVLLSGAGVFFVVGSDLSAITSGFGLGYIMMLGAAIAWVVYSLVTKPLFKKYSQLAIVTYQTIFGTLAFIPFSIFEATPWKMISQPIILNVLYLAVFCSALGYYLYVFSMDYLGVSVSSLFINLIPVVTVIASYFILGEKITGNQIIGGLLVVAAVYLANWEGSTLETADEIAA